MGYGHHFCSHNRHHSGFEHGSEVWRVCILSPTYCVFYFEQKAHRYQGNSLKRRETWSCWYVDYNFLTHIWRIWGVFVTSHGEAHQWHQSGDWCDRFVVCAMNIEPAKVPQSTTILELWCAAKWSMTVARPDLWVTSLRRLSSWQPLERSLLISLSLGSPTTQTI